MSQGIERIFVFGSNLCGIHGAGGALHAVKEWGAWPGQAVGRQGRSYAIPTKATPYKRMHLWRIALHVRDFVTYANGHPQLYFLLTKIGCGRAGWTEGDIAPMFREAPPNVWLIDAFAKPICLASQWEQQLRR